MPAPLPSTPNDSVPLPLALTTQSVQVGLSSLFYPTFELWSALDPNVLLSSPRKQA